MIAGDYKNIDEFYEEPIVYCEYEGIYLDMSKLIEYEDDEDYFDNTMDIIQQLDDVNIIVDDKITFSLRELCNVDDNLIYHVGRKDGTKYLADLVDHIYQGGYSEKK